MILNSINGGYHLYAAGATSVLQGASRRCRRQGPPVAGRVTHGHGELGRVDGDARVGAPRVLVQEFDARHCRRAGVIMRIPARGTVAATGFGGVRACTAAADPGHGSQVAERRRILAVLFQLDDGGALPSQSIREPGAVRTDDQRRRSRRTWAANDVFVSVARSTCAAGTPATRRARPRRRPCRARPSRGRRRARPVRGAGVVHEPRKTHRAYAACPTTARPRGRTVVGLAGTTAPLPRLPPTRANRRRRRQPSMGPPPERCPPGRRTRAAPSPARAGGGRPRVRSRAPGARRSRPCRGSARCFRPRRSPSTRGARVNPGPRRAA